ncbi:NADP-dependent oxidoreductase [Oleomonas cavernae]|uniref:NADP-dependent oxidoreductase n=1 Tax=Oleomonas cavernae TaxID=2320859 RepID=A0A418W9C9_9PROT|nr:NADP-dependent oxidoreductase [Oleomonas cavernae]RJF86598.1 NADP-dependent oxidoreductase [Oleomonas cavernae]
MSEKSHQIVLASRPKGAPVPENFRLEAVAMPAPGAGEVLIRNRFLSVDPYMRGRMNDAKSYVPPFQIGQPLEGGAVGEVVTANDPSLKPGDWVLHNAGWREWALLPAAGAQKIDAAIVPPSAYLGVLGMPGLTAWAGLNKVGLAQPGETVFVSGAAGAVGSLVGQLAKVKGCTAIGSAGGPDKVAWLTDELGFDGAFDYRTEDPVQALGRLAPKGIDVYFENVGGPQFDAALINMKLHGRVAVCGMIAQYNATEPPEGSRAIMLVVPKRINIRGFIVVDYWQHLPEFLAEVAPLVATGKIKFRETVYEGIENTPDAFLALFKGANTGKMVVKL